MTQTTVISQWRVESRETMTRTKGVPKYSLDKLLLRVRPRSGLHKVILQFNNNTSISILTLIKDMRLTAKSTSPIHTLLSAGYFVTNVPNSSIKFCVALLGATPAKPARMARMMDGPCVWTRMERASPRVSEAWVRLMSVVWTWRCRGERDW